ncbi:MAG TPA: hypothetical protein VJB14_16395 [Planctomycetota bacterium]|nr:hypothetical protein [Planctomycetota bacterium]
MANAGKARDLTTVRGRGAPAARFLLAIAAVSLCLSPAAQAGPTPPAEETQQPRNIYELIYSFDHTFAKILSPEELRLFHLRSPEQIREADPELYKRISHDVKAWTLQWIQHVRTTFVPIAEKRLDKAQRTAERVDAILKAHFDARGWPYRTMQVVFLPPRVFLDERDRGSLTSGMFIPFFPEAFFVSVDWPVPMDLLLVHEALHFNKVSPPYGHEMGEGITETGARYLVLKYELLPPREVRRAEAYPRECRGVELVLEEIMKRTAKTRDEALELFLGAYVTGRQDRMNEVFGAETWTRVVKLSQSRGGWQTHKIKAALEK